MEQGQYWKDVQRIIHGHLPANWESSCVQNRSDNHHKRNAKQIEHEDHRLPRVNRFLGAVQRRLVVRCRIVEQRVPIGQQTHPTGIDSQFPDWIREEDGKERRKQHLDTSTRVQNHFTFRKLPLILPVQIDTEPVDDQRENGHETQIQPVVFTEVVLARRANELLVDAISSHASAAVAVRCILQQCPATVQAWTFFHHF